MKRRAYPTDLTDAQWRLIEPLLPVAQPGGRPRSVDLREVVNACLYVAREGVHWRALPHDFPPWPTVYHYFRLWRNDGIWQRVHDALRDQLRQAVGRQVSPSALIVDSQSVKTSEKRGPRGYDGAKRVTGRKRHLLVDTLGLIQTLVVHEADFQDPEGAWFLIAKMAGRFPRLAKMWADGRYTGLVGTMARLFGCDLEIVKRSETARGFEVLPMRWIVERTFAWLGRYRRLTREYEEQPASSEAMIYLAMSHLMVRRLRPA